MAKTKLKNREVIPTLNALSSLGTFPPGLLQLLVARIIDALMPEARRLGQVEQHLLDEYAQKDEHGDPLPAGPGQFIIDPKKRKEFNKAHEELFESEVEVECSHLTENDLDNLANKVGMDPAKIRYLFPFVDKPPQPTPEEPV